MKTSSRNDQGVIDGAVVRGGIPSGVSDDGKRAIPIRATESGEMRVLETEAAQVQDRILSELIAIHTVLEIMLAKIS